MKNIDELENITRIVERVLEEYPGARVNDNYMIFRTLEKINPVVKRMNYTQMEEFCIDQKISFESITRARRKVQAERPELKDETTEIKRLEQMKIFSEWSK